MGLDLARDGDAPAFCPEALVTSVFPSHEDGVRTQRTRWEHGHLGMILGEAPRLLLHGVRHMSVPVVALALDLCVPPLALLVMLLGALGKIMTGLIAGVVLLDVGVQAGHISNQTRIYSLVPEARSRLNMVYMICYFLAGAIGSYAGTTLWQRFGWAGVCGLGCAILLVGCAIHAITGNQQSRPVPN